MFIRKTGAIVAETEQTSAVVDVRGVLWSVLLSDIFFDF